MKALIYKEFKLALHPICYFFVLLFPLMILIPSYPLAIGFIYVITCYPIIFLGANKGQQSNDLLYSALLPIRKKDIVKARIILITCIQFAFIAIMTALYPVALTLSNSIVVEGGEAIAEVGLGLSAYVSLLGIIIVGYSIVDLIFFPIYYKNGKSIVKSTLFTIIGFIVYLLIFTILLTYIPGMEWYGTFLSGNIGYQFIVLGISLIIYVIIHIFVYNISSKRLERVDF